MWFREPRFKVLVSDWWRNTLIKKGNYAFMFFEKLKHIKHNLKVWNMTHFGNIFKEKDELEGTLAKLNAKFLDDGMDEIDFRTRRVYFTSMVKFFQERRSILDKSHMKHGWGKGITT